MKKDQRIAQFLNVKKFPFRIKDDNGNIYDNRKTLCTPKTVIIDGKEYELKEVKQK